MAILSITLKEIHKIICVLKKNISST